MNTHEKLHYTFFSVLRYPRDGIKKLNFFGGNDVSQAEENPTNMYISNQVPKGQQFVLKRIDYVYEQRDVKTIVYTADKNRIFNSAVVVELEIGCKRYFHGCGLREDALNLTSEYPILIGAEQNFCFSMTFSSLVPISSDAKIGVVLTGILQRPVC